MTVLVLLALLADPNPPSLDPLPALRATVTHHFDGDTVTARLISLSYDRAGRSYVSLTTEDVRLDGYDAPELREPGGPEATEALRRLLASGEVWVKPTGGRTFGRIIARAYVLTPEGVVIDVSQAMIRLGHIKHP